MIVDIPPHKKMKAYLAGPMSGLPANNYPEFRLVESALLGNCIESENPATTTLPLDSIYLDFIVAGLGKMQNCSEIILLEGYKNSLGACIELLIAVRSGLRVYEFNWLSDGKVTYSLTSLHPSLAMEIAQASIRKLSL